EVSGTIYRVEPRTDGWRITLENVIIDGIAPKDTPARIRLNYKSKEPTFFVGDTIKGYAHLVPPMLPMQEGAYDFSRAAWYMQLGAVGRLTELTEYKKTATSSSLRVWFERIRSYISNRVQQILPPDSAAIAVPLIIGDQGLVTPYQYELYRISGIIHVLSVSGFHLTLLAGLVFFLIRGFFALMPALASYINTKKISAVLSLAVVLFYLFISGLQIPAVRSFLMIAVVLLAVIADRSAISLRTAVLAGCFILFFWPESILSSGFQLSFIAVFAMLSLYEVFMRKLKNSPYRHNFLYKCWLLFIGSICVSLLATLSTAPYAAFHFNQFAPYSVLGNLLTSVLFSFAIMPLLLAAVLLMPFGWDALFLKGTGFCLDIITKICEWIKTLPHADITVPAFDLWGLVVITVGWLILFFFQGKIRWIGLPIALLGFFSFLTVAKPDILVSDDGKVFAVRQENGLLALSDKTANTMASDTWLRRNGQNPTTDITPRFNQKTVWIKGKKIAFSSLACADADLSILTKYEIGDCPNLVLKPIDFRKNKTHAVYIENGEIDISWITKNLRNRPWVQFFLAPSEKTNYIGE
ncbi:MAG: ComEC/Rec2 family competence protein, partial [Alphaproteobacteria bacterium]|nr:ComEC/Rec2 family competence protein [Alphaproteobacteria bacterium]